MLVLRLVLNMQKKKELKELSLFRIGSVYKHYIYIGKMVF